MALVYKMSDVYSLSDDFKEKFEILTTVTVGDKFIIHDGKLLKDETMRLTQPFTRWWNNQNRYDILSLLEEDLDGYLGFLKFVWGAHKSPKTASRERRQLLNIYKSHKPFRSSLVSGIGCISITYENSPDIHNRLAKLISDLNYLP